MVALYLPDHTEMEQEMEEEMEEVEEVEDVQDDCPSGDAEDEEHFDWLSDKLLCCVA